MDNSISMIESMLQIVVLLLTLSAETPILALIVGMVAILNLIRSSRNDDKDGQHTSAQKSD